MNIEVIFQPAGRKVEVPRGVSVWTAAEKGYVTLSSTCGGQSICGKCRIKILNGNANSINEVEREYLTDQELQEGYRLACEVRVFETLSIETPDVEDDRKSKVRLPIPSMQIPLSPSIQKVDAKVPSASLNDPRSDATRLVSALNNLGYQPPVLNLLILKQLPRLLKESNHLVSCIFDENGFIAIEPGDKPSGFYGLAVDLGTTTAAAYLVNLDSGEMEGSEAISNRQAIYGDDVMSRLSYAQSGGSKKLNSLAVRTINELIEQVCNSQEVQRENVYSIAITGNTAMLHFLSGLPTDNMGVAPYTATRNSIISASASEMGLQIHPSASVWLLPGIGAFAGADCVSGAHIVGMQDSEDIQLMIDFGTNAEIVLGSQNGLVGCATAAGPAFEGARIQHGMRAATGAIDRVWIADRHIHYSTINHKSPTGIAGTGLVSAVAALRTAGLIDKNGVLTHKDTLSADCWIKEDNGLKVILVPGSNKQATVTLSQSDISEYQLAKAAVRAGIKILQQKIGVNKNQIKRILLAGAFGSFIDASDALAADLLPEVPIEIIESAGNAAGYGAIAALVSKMERTKICHLANSIQYVELSTEPDFNRLFAKALVFK
jgi:uncharacterized 2Fe-2S/4Fe-4S cluster protein (DUF4445 family)